MAEYSPLPWRVENINQTWHVEAADGSFVALFVREADAALIVEAVNERDRLRDIVRRLCDELESHYHEPGSMDDPCIVSEAREALEDEQ
jgi:hypothetical protein